ncbi:hypothetical protein ED92_15425 [Amycolatopsis sp. MJM2582]|nr:hypothetical protein ED92_15425 [Amycolatopsis sp. MJM2582]
MPPHGFPHLAAGADPQQVSAIVLEELETEMRFGLARLGFAQDLREASAAEPGSRVERDGRQPVR